MNRFLLLTVVVSMGLLIFAEAPAAQVKEGDLVLTASSGTTGLFYTTWPGPLKAISSGVTLNAVKMVFGNLYVYAIGTNTGNVYRFYQTGAVATVSTNTPSGGAGIGLDQDGSAMVVNYSNYKFYRVIGNPASEWMTLSSSYGRPNAICRDGNTGDWIVGTVSGIGTGRLVRINRQTKSVYTLSSTIGAVYGVDWIPQTGEFVVACMRGTRQYVSWVTSSGSLRYSFLLSYVNCVTVNQKTGQVFAATSQGRVNEYTYGGKYIRYRSYGTSYLFTGIDVWGDQNVSVSASTSRKTVQVYLKFARSPGMPYVVALSFAPRPGLPLTTNTWLNLNPDALFFLTLGGKLPYFTHRFAGKLSSSGYSGAYFVMPYSGARVYVSAAAINPAFPAGIDIGNVEVVNNW